MLGPEQARLAADRVEPSEVAREPWIRFGHGSTLDGVLRAGRAAGQRAGPDHGRPRLPDGDGGALDSRAGLRGASRFRAPHASRRPLRFHARRPRVRPAGDPAEMALLEFLREESRYYTGSSGNGSGCAHNWVAPPSTTSSVPVV
ncbi:hypothetical protein [Streptomyces sp. WG5]|uniref:hypothetical protein n=1 Tax=Streptomyces sp. WG5 TaxID=3417648 RepID=UPI003CF72B2C